MKILYVILFLLSASIVQGQGIQFFHGSFEDALKKAEKEGKQIFVDVYTSWCGPCKQMATKVFTDEKVGKYYNDKFVCIKLDADKDKEYGFFKKYQASGYPSLFWLTDKGELIDMNVGFLGVEQFIAKAEALKNSKLNENIAAYQKRWEGGERSIELVDKYLFGVISKLDPAKFRPYCLDYLKSIDEEQLRTATTYKILSCFMRDMEPGLVFDLHMKYWNDYSRFENYLDFNIKHYRWIVRGTYVAATKSEKEFKERMKVLKSVEFPNKKMYLDIIDAELLLMKDINQTILAYDKLLNRYGKENPYLYSQFVYSLVNAGYFSPKNTDKTHLDKVRMMTEQAYELFPSQETAVYVAATYAKAGDYAKAYAALGSLPFLPRPVLSNALYPKLGLLKRPKTEYGKTAECAERKAEVEKMMKEHMSAKQPAGR